MTISCNALGTKRSGRLHRKAGMTGLRLLNPAIGLKGNDIKYHRFKVLYKTHRVTHVEQKLFTLPGHISSLVVLSGVRCCSMFSFLFGVL
jgi:hypothetical protein